MSIVISPYLLFKLSLLEAMAGCSTSSSTPPVLEVLEDGISALLNDFHNVDAHAESIMRILDDRNLSRRLAQNAQSHHL